MKAVRQPEVNNDYQTLLSELERLFREDPTDQAAADFMLSLLYDRVVDFKLARALYREAILRAYFNTGDEA